MMSTQISTIISRLGSMIFMSFFFAVSLHAQIIFTEDFQDGDADGWSADARDGDIRLSIYHNNNSLLLTRNAFALRKVALGDAEKINVRASFAAQNLEDGDTCRLDISFDGKEWFEVGRVSDGQDDAVTLHTVQSSFIVNDGAEILYMGVRIEGNADNDSCWVDNISVKAMRDTAKLPANIPSTALWSKAGIETPLSMQAFTPPQAMIAPKLNVSGRVIFDAATSDNFELLKDDFLYSDTTNSLAQLGSFDLEIVQRGTDIIPVMRGPRASEHPDWEWIFEPGAAWENPQNPELARVSLPFSLQERNANCIHNGVMMFEVSRSGDISDMVYQIGSETCAYLQFNMWGGAPLSFDAFVPANTKSIIDAYDAGISARLAVRPISQLPFRDQFGSADEVDPAALTTFGYIKDGAHYAGGCETRFGPYPFCDVMDIPSYSWAKSIVGGLASMRLERLYPGAMDSLISDYVPECKGWTDVTFKDALNMSTGRYTSKHYDVDEAASRPFFLADTHAEKIKYACQTHKRRDAPGKTFVYHTTDTYILGAAITAYLRKHSGNGDADIFETLLTPIFSDLGLSPVALQTRRTYDNERQAFTGWGLTFHRSDVAILAQFIAGGGKINGKNYLDAAMLDAALQKLPGDRGLRAVIDSQKYKNGFWAWNAGAALGCTSDVWIPAWSGYGGLSAAFMPNGHIYYYISDGNDFKWAKAALASHKISPLCASQ